MKVGITGHRPARLKGREEEVRLWIIRELQELKEKNEDISLITGMARGVDQIAALAAIDLHIPVECIFPYQHCFSEAEQYIVDHAMSVRFFSDKYKEDVFLARDRRLVEESDILLVVWDGKFNGGAYNTYKYANSLRKEIWIFPW